MLRGQRVPLANFTAGYGLWLAVQVQPTVVSQFAPARGASAARTFKLMQPCDPNRRIIVMLLRTGQQPSLG